jgi:hypothetical protein
MNQRNELLSLKADWLFVMSTWTLNPHCDCYIGTYHIFLSIITNFYPEDGYIADWGMQ